MKPPLIAPKAFSEHTPESWIAFVRSLKQEPEKKSSGLVFSWTKKGKPSLRVTGEIKFATQIEIETLARENNCPISELYLIAKEKLTLTKEVTVKPKKEKKNVI